MEAIRPVTAASAFGALLSLLVPSRCAACDRPRTDLFGGGVCRACWGALPLLDPSATCPHCALPGDGAPCSDCRQARPEVARAAALALYAGPMRALVLAFKFRGWDILAGAASDRLADLARRTGLAGGADALVPVPSTRRRNRERGYDPAGLLAEELGRRLDLPVTAGLRRRRDTVPQSSLPAVRRPANVAGAFEGSPRTAGRALLLVDDVVTTGATAFAAARALRRAGAARVDLLVLARTPEPDDFRQPDPA
jgi:ComF family protein